MAVDVRLPLRSSDLSSEQRTLVRLIREQRFGRIENLPVRAGQPIFNSDVKVVRVSKLGSESVVPEGSGSEEFELKRPLVYLFEELDRLQNGVIVLLEFRHG